MAVTVLEVAERILAPEEPEASALVTEVFANEGITVLTGVSISRVDYTDGRFSVSLEDQTLVDLLPMVRRVVGARIRDPQTVEDLVQETVLRVMAARTRSLLSRRSTSRMSGRLTLSMASRAESARPCFARSS